MNDLPPGASLITTSRGKFYGNGLDLAWLSGREAEGGAQDETALEARRMALMHDFQHLLARMIQFPVSVCRVCVCMIFSTSWLA